MFWYEGVSCDVCLKGNFWGCRYKCLICYDYDFCVFCYESGVIIIRYIIDYLM